MAHTDAKLSAYAINLHAELLQMNIVVSTQNKTYPSTIREQTSSTSAAHDT